MTEIVVQGGREAILLSMGYTSYENYLLRAHWKRIKQRVLERDDWTCRRCNGKAELVHHRAYSREVLAGLDDSQLASICDGCHRIVEFRDDGTRRTFGEKDEVLLTRAPIASYPPVKVDMRRKNIPVPNGWARMDWWQRTGWRAEYMFGHYTKKLAKSPYGKLPGTESFLGHHRALYEAVRNRTPESHWRDMPLYELRTKDDAASVPHSRRRRYLTPEQFAQAHEEQQLLTSDSNSGPD